MKAVAMFVVGLLLAAGPAVAQKVYIQYDATYDGNSVKTFAWKETSETSLADANPLLHARIVKGIEYYLILRGLQEVDRNPDVWVTYHTSTEKEVRFDTTSFGYGYPATWRYYGGPVGYGYGGTVASTTTARTYQKGTLVVDVWDASSNKLVWRGTAAKITVTESPTKMEKKVDQALKKMVNAWEKTKRKNGM